MNLARHHLGLGPRLGRAVAFVTLVVAVIALLIAHVIGWRWVRLPFLGVLIEPTLVISSLRNDGLTGEGLPADLAHPNRLVALDGQRLLRSADVEAVLAAHDVGDRVPVTVECPGGNQLQVEAALTEFPLRVLVNSFLVPHLAGWICLGIGFWVYWMGGRARGKGIFVVMCAAFAIVLAGIFEINTTHRLVAVWGVAVPFTAASALHLVLIFPHRPPFVRRFPITRLLPYSVALFLAVGSIQSVYDLNHPWDYIGQWRGSYLFCMIGISLHIVILIYRLIHPPSPLVRKQSRIILLGSTLAFIPLMPWLIANMLNRPMPFFAPLHALPTVLFPLSIAYAILRYRLLDIDRLLSRGVVYSGLTLLIVAAYFLVVDTVSQFIAVRASDPLMLSISVLVLVVIFNPLRNWVQGAVDRLFLRETIDYHEALQDFSHELTQKLDLEAVLSAIGHRIRRALNPSTQWICLYDEDTSSYLGQPIGPTHYATFPVTFMPEGCLARWLRGHQECLYLPPEEGLPTYLADEWVQMGAMGAVVYVPLRIRERLIGWLAVGNKTSGRPYRTNDLAFLSALADQSAMAVENARLFTSVRNNLAAITDMKNLMDDVFSSIASGVITTNVEDRITLFNQAAEEMLGIPADQIIGAHCKQALSLLSDELFELVEQVKTSERPVMAYEAQPEIPERGTTWLRMNLSPLKNSRDVTTGVTIVVDDLTEQRELEARMRTIRQTFERYVAPAVVERLLSTPESVRLGGLRQEITSFYADIRGFTRFSEKSQPEFQIEVLNKHLTLAAEAILGEEGTLDKFVGDSAMAIFNAPEPQRDHTLRAVRAALAMQNAIHQRHEEMEDHEQLHFGVGITVGQAVVGNIGSTVVHNFTAIGDCVNLSCRLSDLAEGGQILLGAEAYRRVESHVEARSMGELEIRGHTTPDEIYEVVGLR